MSSHFSFITALIILGWRTRFAVTETPFVEASGNGMDFNFFHIGSYCLIPGFRATFGTTYIVAL